MCIVAARQRLYIPVGLPFMVGLKGSKRPWIMYPESCRDFDKITSPRACASYLRPSKVIMCGSPHPKALQTLSDLSVGAGVGFGVGAGVVICPLIAGHHLPPQLPVQRPLVASHQELLPLVSIQPFQEQKASLCAGAGAGAGASRHHFPLQFPVQRPLFASHQALLPLLSIQLFQEQND